MPTDWVALASGPVFAIAVASYLLVRIDKTLGEMRDTMRDVSAGIKALPSSDTIKEGVKDGVYAGLQENRVRGNTP